MANLALRNSSLRPAQRGEDADPMSTMGNLADVMLVFACGLMLALITYWNIDVSAKNEILPDQKVSEVQNPEDITDQLRSEDGTAYLDMGRLWMDPTTGKYYMIVDDGTEEGAAAAQSMPSAQQAVGADSVGTTELPDNLASIEGGQVAADASGQADGSGETAVDSTTAQADGEGSAQG